ncbi:MAG: hypothetical protein JJV93_02125 [Alphaproteobacteria bacterium]|nr:hypothetical protein [Alphaproteobacteria bacterium]MBL0718038.1 hypothetical protein [Alphaproteobacteria bacterium]
MTHLGNPIEEAFDYVLSQITWMNRCGALCNLRDIFSTPSRDGTAVRFADLSREILEKSYISLQVVSPNFTEDTEDLSDSVLRTRVKGLVFDRVQKHISRQQNIVYEKTGTN